jgi:hypothetical protein
MIKDSQPRSAKGVSWMGRIIVGAALLILAFMLGYVPMWQKSRDYSRNLAVATHQLILAGIQNSLASAAIDARRGDYEAARQAASSFYTSLRAETDRGAGSILSQAQREGAQPLFARQDEIITLLSRNDPAAAEQLSDLYVSYLEIINK